MATTMRSAEELKAYEQRFVDEVWNSGEYDLVEETVSEDYVGHWFDPAEEAVDREGFEAFVQHVRDGFPDFHMDVELMLAEDNLIAVVFTCGGTHEGEFMGVPPTGKSGNTPGIFVHRFDDEGKVTEAWAVWDALGMLQQLEVMPESFTLAALLETGAKMAKQDVLKLTKGK